MKKILFPLIFILLFCSAAFAGDATSYTLTDVTPQKISGVPVGTVVPWPAGSVPDGWLECNGQSTSGHSELAAIVGSRVPDLRGEFIRGWDHGRGVDGGRSLLNVQSDQLQAHNHIQGLPETNVRNPSRHTRYGYTSGPMHGGVGDDESRVSNRWFFTSTTGGSETRPRNVAMMYIIKAE
ncbi:tail fiber protein [Desulfovibrio sp. JC022]|uniref:tail fiber protein n=1 Tax=Desulfovibrio sp. JC022 TaxID=2593642 RepID=UPI0013D22538|nr:tail fiber protein [Desulfovibrio sp. JC022]NDV23131.1 phage tail protein [Desulfovibrio sp. JC022]